MTTAIRHATRLLGSAVVVIALAAGAAASSRAASPLRPYPWPVKPFDRPHPVRGSFGDPRTVFANGPSLRTLLAGGGSFSFHFGIDVAAPNGTPVYPVEPGAVTVVSTGKGREYVEVTGTNGRSFQYWHIAAAVAHGQRVETGRTVLGRILRPSGHVHLTEIDHGVIVNPLARGHLAPYADTTAPAVTRIEFRRATAGPRLGALRLRGRVEIVASVEDFPAVPVPGAWHDLPVTPAVVAWSVRSAATGRLVLPRRVVYDVRGHLPAAVSFWTVYARGTHQNMTTFGTHYSYREPGAYLFRLAPGGLDTGSLRPGAYRLVVTVTDVRGNRGSAERPFGVAA